MHVVITGASKGFGRAIAEIFAENGHSLWLCSKNAMLLQETADDISVRFPRSVVKWQAADLSNKRAAMGFGDWLIENDVPVDVLINNAGIFMPGNIADEADGVFEDLMAVNLYSAYYLTRTLLPGMKARKTGHIFNMCSIASLAAYAYGGSYSISKFALLGFSKNLRLELMPFNIKVTAVLPGAALTDSWKGYDNSSGRIMEAGDIAKMIYAATQLSPQAVVEDILLRPQLGDL